MTFTQFVQRANELCAAMDAARNQFDYAEKAEDLKHLIEDHGDEILQQHVPEEKDESQRTHQGQ